MVTFITSLDLVVRSGPNSLTSPFCVDDFIDDALWLLKRFLVPPKSVLRAMPKPQNNPQNEGTVLPLFDSPLAMEPLLPEGRRNELAELTLAIHRAAGKLGRPLHQSLLPRLAVIVREMNSYYSNLIEGQHTYPRDMEAARTQKPAADAVTRKRQLLGLAHLETEEWMRAEILAKPELNVAGADFLMALHREFYRRLPDAEQVILARDGLAANPLLVGGFRTTEVTVGAHHPPAASSLPQFMARFGSFYGGGEIIATRRLIAVAAAHHRLAWIHPFGDGNGRVSRLFTHAALIRAQVDAGGLWTISRGLARQRARYYELLAAADQQRHGSTDGRGNLSDRSLAEFCDFFLTTMLDQIQFMDSLFDLEALEKRIVSHALETKVFAEAHTERGAWMLRELLRRGEMDRSSIGSVVDRGEVTTRKILSAAETAGLIAAKNKQAPYQLLFDADVCDAYFPKLFLAAI